MTTLMHNNSDMLFSRLAGLCRLLLFLFCCTGFARPGSMSHSCWWEPYRFRQDQIYHCERTPPGNDADSSRSW